MKINLKEKCSQLYVSLKNLFEKFIAWRKEDFWTWCLKFLLLILTALLIIVLIQIVPYLFAFGVLILLFCSDQLAALFASNNQNQSGSCSLEYYFAFSRDIVCRISKENADLLNVYPPTSINDITPVQYQSLQCIHDFPIFRFILLKKPDSETDLSVPLSLFNQKIAQYLQSGEAPLSAPFYNGFPCLYALSLKEDLYHTNCLCLDLIPITNDRTYLFLKTLLEKRSKNSRTENISTLLDQDF